MHPVLLVHGIMDRGWRFGRMRTALEAHALGPVHAMEIVPNDGSITFAVMGEQVRESANALLLQTGASKVDIVAFSMGALAVRQFLHFLDGHRQVRRFISLSGPHHGTLTARLNFNSAGRQMRPGSTFLKELNAGEGNWGDVEVHSFWTPLDLTIFPSESSRLEGADNRTFPVMLHPLMITDRRVIQAVAEVLAQP